MEFEPCRIENFKINLEFFDKLRLNNTLCLKNGSINLKGYWDVEKTSMLSFTLDRCVNSSDKIDNICKSDEEIAEYFNSNYFNVFYQDNSFDLANFNQPITSKIKYMYSRLEYGRTKVARLFLKKTTIISDSQAIFPKEDVINSYSFDKIEYDSYKSETTMFSFNIHASDIKTILKRKYQKFFELVAVLGGITKSLTIFGSVLLKIIYDWKINELIMKSLFIFRDSIQSKRIHEPFEIINNENFLISTDPIESNRIAINSNRSIRISTDPNGSLPIRNYPRTRRRNKKKKEIQDETNESNKILKLTFWEKAMMFMKKGKNRTEKETLYLDYFRKSDIKLDLINILRKLEEIDRLKMILLNDEQIKFFNSISKQYIFMGDAEKKAGNKFNLDTRCFEKDENNKKRKILFEKIKSDHQKNEVDKRLLDLIEE